MEKTARQILGDEEFSNLREDIMNEIDSETSPMEMFSNIEDLMLSYGLEMDYIFDVIGF